MATVPCIKCTAERRGFRRELDSWRHKLLHCMGFESILKGIYGPMLMRDLNLFADCEPEDIDDWSLEGSSSKCSFCNLPLDKLSEQAPVSTSPLSSPSDYSPCQALTPSESQSAQKFLHAVFHKKDVPPSCNSNIPVIAQELMRKMIHQFALEYASECLLHPEPNDITCTPSPQSETSDVPLDLTLTRTQEEKEIQPTPDGVLDLSNRNIACSPTAPSSSQKLSGRQWRQKEEYTNRSWELSERLLSKALKDISSGRLQEQRAALLYGIPLQTLRQGLDEWMDGRLEGLHHLSPKSRDEISINGMSTMLGGDARLVLQKVAAWAERAEIGGAGEENGDYSIPSSAITLYHPSGLQKTFPNCFPQLRDALQPPKSPTPSLEPPTTLRIPQVRSISDPTRALPSESCSLGENPQRTSSTEGLAISSSAVKRPLSLFKLRPPYLAQGCYGSASQSPHRLGPRGSSLDESEDGTSYRDKDKQPRKKRGRYRQYDHELMEEAITMVMGGRMSVSKAQSLYGVPHSTLEYKIKERTGTLKNPPKKKPANFGSSISNSPSSGTTTGSTNSGSVASAADAKSSLQSSSKEEQHCLERQGKSRCVLDSVLSNLCQAHRSLLYQILKLAHQEKLLTIVNHKPVGQTKSHCGISPQTTDKPPSDAVGNSSLCHHTDDRDNYGHSTTGHCPEDSKSCQSIHQCKHKEEASDSCSCVQRCRVETYSVLCSKRVHCHSCHGGTVNGLCPCEASPALSQSPVHRAHSSTLSLSPQICCCKQSHSCPLDSLQICSIRSVSKGEHDLGKPDPTHLVLKREQSPSPPPLSPIYSEIIKTDDKPPSLFYHEKREHTGIQDDIVHACHDLATVGDLQNKAKESSHTELGHSGTSLQDLMKRFSEKLETIKPSDKDPNLFSTAIYASEEQQQSPTTSQNLHFHADSHLTEIITTVLHTGCASDYSLTELFNNHQNREPKSPNTRSRRRQEVLAAIAKPTDDASTRRHSLKIKRELAMLDQSCNKRKKKRAQLKDGSVIETGSSALSDPLSVTTVAEKEVNGVVFLEKPEGIAETFNHSFSAKITRKDLKEECKMGAEVKQIKTALNISEPSNEETEPTVSDTHEETPDSNSVKCTSEGDCFDKQVITKISNLADESLSQKLSEHCSNGSMMKHQDSSVVHSCDTKNRTAEDKDLSPDWKTQKCQSNYYNAERRSRRKIVPPQRFSSYVTEPRNTFFVACFSEGVFNRGVQKEESLMPSTIHTVAIDSEVNGNQFESPNKECFPLPETTKLIANEKGQKVQHELFEHSKQWQSISETVAADKLSPEKHSPHRTDKREKLIVDDCNVMPVGRLRSSARKTQVTKTEESSSDRHLSIEASSLNKKDQYTSPIKLMFVSPMKDTDRLRLSLKSGSQTEHFDPCEEYSWSGTSQRHRRPCKKFSASPAKSSASSPAKSTAYSPAKSTASSPVKSTASSPVKSTASSPVKSSASSPVKSVDSHTRSPFSSPRRLAFLESQFSSSPTKSACLLRSATSSPKNDSGRSGEQSPSKQNHKAESERSPNGLPSQTSPPRRRPGRPKKLGPPLVQKLKKPIGRPRKEKIDDSVSKTNSVNGDSNSPSRKEECVTKSLKIMVMCGRSRRNKRTVSECSDQRQTEFNCVKQPGENQIDYASLLYNSKTTTGILTKNPEELNILGSEKVTRNIKCQDSSIHSRKPGRPQKVKISGISVTITMSPRQRKIQFNKDNYLNPETTIQRKVLLKSPRKSEMINPHVPCDQNEAEEETESKAKIKDERPNSPIGLRHSSRVRKPSIHFLRAVATSSFRSYSRSNALLRRSKQLLLNKASNERRLEEQLTRSELTEVAKQVCKDRSSLPDLSGVAEVSVDPIFPTEETLKWWEPSAEDYEMNQELTRRIRIISDTWIIDTEENQHKETAGSPSLGAKAAKPFTRTLKENSVVRTLFDCPPNKPSSCSMQQISSWFMQTTETQPLAIVKKKTRNHYDPVQFSRSISKTVVCPSPQAERLKKHLKKFAQIVPKSPLEHQAALRRVKVHLLRLDVRRQLFTQSFPMTLDSGVGWRRSRTTVKLQAILFRVKKRFLTRKEREQKKWMEQNNRNVAHRKINRQTKQNTSRKSTEGRSPNCTKTRPFISAVGQTHPVKEHKEQNLSTTAWSSGMLKECRVFLKKLNSPDHKLTDKVSGCRTSGEGPSSQYLDAESQGKSTQPDKDVTLVGKLKAPSRQVESPSKTDQEWNNGEEILSDEPLPPPSTRRLRPSRTRRLTGPKWSDFVFGNYLALFD